MAKSYESLIGAVGRSVFYRPDRQPIRELLSRDATPKVVIEGEAFPVFDVSMNGVSLLLNGRQSEWQVGQELRLSLLLYNEEVYEGAARVARIERGSRGSQIGLGLTNGFLDLPAMQRRDDEKKLERSLCEGPAAVERLVPADYQAIVGRIGHFFQYHRRSLDYHEQRLRAEGAGEPGILDSPLEQRMRYSSRGDGSRRKRRSSHPGSSNSGTYFSLPKSSPRRSLSHSSTMFPTTAGPTTNPLAIRGTIN